MRWLMGALPFSALLLSIGCITTAGSLVGVVAPDSVNSRFLALRNDSRGYVVFRVTIPDAEPLTTTLLPPGAHVYQEMFSRFATVCPAFIRVEIAAYDPPMPPRPPFDDWPVPDEPYASVVFELQPTTHFGCLAEVEQVTLDDRIDCVVHEADPSAGTIGFEAGWMPAQRQRGLQVADPPPPATPETFPLRGRVVDLQGTPLPGVPLYLPQYDASVYTNADGIFGIALPQGDYLIEPMLDGVEVSPAWRLFTHTRVDEVPIEFIVLTEKVPPTDSATGAE